MADWVFLIFLYVLVGFAVIYSRRKQKKSIHPKSIWRDFWA